MTSTPSYITKNRLGIYYFQYTIPSIILKSIGQTGKQLFRKSLRTRNRRDALKKSRFLWLIMDKLSDQYFSSPESYGKAMTLLKKFHDIPDSDYPAIDNFLANLDDVEDHLLDKAIAMNQVNNAHNQTREDLLDTYKQLNRQLKNIPQFYTVIEDPRLSVLIDKWLEFKKPTLKPTSHESNKQHIGVFHGIICEIHSQDPTSSQISETMIRKFKEILEKIPVHRNAKKHNGKSYTELSELGLPPISQTTYQIYTLIAGEFIKWLESQGYPVNSKISAILSSVRKIVKSEVIKALPFDENDLIAIFNSKQYTSGNIDHAADYWVPLIALFSGARLKEICQLELSDIYQKNSIWLISINDDGDNKSIKASGSKRVIPLHPTLKKLGLLEYINMVTTKKEKRLFPYEQQTISGKFDSFSKRFGYQLKILSITAYLKQNERKSFHSFRHTVRTKFVDASIEGGLIDSIIGHESENRSIGEKTYTHTQLIPQKVKALNKLEYTIDFTKIRNWQNCKFTKLEKA